MRRKLNVCSNSTAKKFEKRKIRLELHTQIRKYCHGRPILRNKLICRLSCLKSGKSYLLDKYISTLWIAQYDSLESDHPLDSVIHSLKHQVLLLTRLISLLGKTCKPSRCTNCRFRGWVHELRGVTAMRATSCA